MNKRKGFTSKKETSEAGRKNANINKVVKISFWFTDNS